MSLPHGTYSQSLTSSVSNPNPEPTTVWDFGEEACELSAVDLTDVFDECHCYSVAISAVVGGGADACAFRESRH